MIKIESFIGAIYEAVLRANDALTKKNLELLEVYFETSEKDSSKLVPKTVTIQYPKITREGGAEVHDVHVPLISIIPISTTEISEVKLITELEILLEEDILLAGFSTNKSNRKKTKSKDKEGGFFPESTSTSTSTRLEITISPSTPPEGLKRLIEGYERALRAQIPG